jgi:hypothetical protein
MRIWISALILAMAAAGCGSSAPPQNGGKEDKTPAPTVFDDTVRTIDKAKESQALQENRVNDLNRQLEAQEEGGKKGDEQGAAGGATPSSDPDAVPNAAQQSN